MDRKAASGPINQKLKEARKLKGYSQAELARLMNVSRQTVSNWECGLSIPDVMAFHKLQQYLEVPVKQLLGNEAIGDAIASKENLNEHEIAVQLTQMTAFYATEIERRKMLERRALIIIGLIIILGMMLLMAMKLFFYPSRIVIQPNVESTEHVDNP